MFYELVKSVNQERVNIHNLYLKSMSKPAGIFFPSKCQFWYLKILTNVHQYFIHYSASPIWDNTPVYTVRLSVALCILMYIVKRFISINQTQYYIRVAVGLCNDILCIMYTFIHAMKHCFRIQHNITYVWSICILCFLFLPILYNYAMFVKIYLYILFRTLGFFSNKEM